MKKWVLPQARNAAYRTIAIPAGVVFVSAVCLLFYHSHASYSLCLGGITWVLPNLYFVSKAFSNMRPDALNKIMKNFFLAEFNKLALTALLAVLILKYIKVKILFFFIGYVIAQVVFWLTPFLLNRVKKA
jgi:ATP synthase protein I